MAMFYAYRLCIYNWGTIRQDIDQSLFTAVRISLDITLGPEKHLQQSVLYLLNCLPRLATGLVTKEQLATNFVGDKKELDDALDYLVRIEILIRYEQYVPF